MAHAVQHHLGDRLLAEPRLAGALVIDRLGQALERPVCVLTAGVQHERPHRPDRQLGERPHGVDLLGRLHRRRVEAEIGNLRDVETGPADCPTPGVGTARQRIMPLGQGQHRRVHIGGQSGQATVGEGPRHLRHPLRPPVASVGVAGVHTGEQYHRQPAGRRQGPDQATLGDDLRQRQRRGPNLFQSRLHAAGNWQDRGQTRQDRVLRLCAQARMVLRTSRPGPESAQRPTI